MYRFTCAHAQSHSHVQLFASSADQSQPGSSAHGLFQTRTLKWAAISYPRGSSQPDRSTSLVSNSYQNPRRFSLDIDKINPKIIWKGKISRTAKQFEGGREAKYEEFQDLHSYGNQDCVVLVAKHTDQRNRIENLQTDPHKYTKWIFSKDAK